MNEFARIALAAAAAASLAACETWPPEGPPNYRTGFGDGCLTGYYEAGRQTAFPVKRPLYGSDENYRRGWHDGYDRCFEIERRQPWVGGPNSPI